MGVTGGHEPGEFVDAPLPAVPARVTVQALEVAPVVILLADAALGRIRVAVPGEGAVELGSRRAGHSGEVARCPLLLVDALADVLDRGPLGLGLDALALGLDLLEGVLRVLDLLAEPGFLALRAVIVGLDADLLDLLLRVRLGVRGVGDRLELEGLALLGQDLALAMDLLEFLLLLFDDVILSVCEVAGLDPGVPDVVGMLELFGIPSGEWSLEPGCPA